MPENEILAEIHRIREEMMRECNFDLKEFFARRRESERALIAAGWPVADLKPATPKERPVGVD